MVEAAEPKARVRRYLIRDVNGEVQAVHVRRERRGGGKAFHWEQLDGRTGLGGRPIASLPLYGSERLRDLPDSTLIVICEGEKATEALNGVGFPDLFALGTVTGAPAAPDGGVLESVARFETLVLWPDNDDVGSEQMARCAERLRSIGAHGAKRITWPEAPEGGDAADFVAQASDASSLAALLDAATPWLSPGEPDRPEEKNGTSPRRTQTSRLLELADGWELFHDPDGGGYAWVADDGCRQSWALPGAGCEDALRRAYFEQYQSAPADRSLKDALGTLAARARYQGDAKRVFLRYGQVDDQLVVDLADPSGAVVVISPLALGARRARMERRSELTRDLPPRLFGARTSDPSRGRKHGPTTPPREHPR